MTFTFQNLSATSTTIPVPLAGLPMNTPESRLFHDTLNLLGRTLAASRRLATIHTGSDQRAQFEVVFGYAMLALDEGRALWSLLSRRLETMSLVHLRTIVEHAARTTRLIKDAELARRVYDSLGASERELAADFELEPQVRELLEEQFSPVVEAKADRHILPSMSKLLKQGGLLGIDYGAYRAMSQTVHGSIIALRQVAHVTSNVDRDFIDASARDGSAATQLMQATHLIMVVMNDLAFISGANIDSDFMRLLETHTELTQQHARRLGQSRTIP